MRWKELLIGLMLASAAGSGCKEQCSLSKCDEEHYRQEMNLPANLEHPDVAIVPSGADGKSPPTILDPERPPRYLTLTEAIALSLEQGTVGSGLLAGSFNAQQNINLSNDALGVFSGRNVSLADGIRVLALEPAAVGTDIEASLAKFDAHWTSSINWQKTDEPVGGNFLQNFQNGDRSTFSSSLLKPLPSGGVAGITFNTQYTRLDVPPVGVTNPGYRPALQFQFEQPLLQGFGVEINQLRATHPGSLLTPFNTGGRVEGILITRLRFDQQRADFERSVNLMLLNVETAYWQLYDAYWTLYSREQGLRQAFAAWKANKFRYEEGRISRQDLAQTRQQYELFRGQRITALDQVLENERQIRSLVGLPVEDGCRLIPIDSPTLAFYQPDWDTSLNETLVLRPELVLARQDLKVRQLELINQKNTLLPDLRFTSQYSINGFGTHLDGGSGDPNNAFHSLASDQFSDWTLGIRADIPLGRRDASAAVRQAKLRLSQSYFSLREQEKKAKSLLAQQYRLLSATYERARAQRAQREAASVALESRLREYLAGKIILDILLKAQQDWADALQGEYEAISQYNITLARFEFSKGTLLEHDSVLIAEGPLPHCAQVRAVEHERRRSKALVLRERAAPVNQPPADYGTGNPGLPELPEAAPPSIPSLYEKMPAIEDAAEGKGAPQPLPLPGNRLLRDSEEPSDLLPPSGSGKPGSLQSSAPTELPGDWGAVKPAVADQDTATDGIEQLPLLKVTTQEEAGRPVREGQIEGYLPPFQIQGQNARPPGSFVKPDDKRSAPTTPDTNPGRARIMWQNN